jgi:hypothetical protein
LEVTNQRIDNLEQGMVNLDVAISNTRKDITKEIEAAEAAAIKASQKENECRPGLAVLPQDIRSYVVGFLSIGDVAHLETSCHMGLFDSVYSKYWMKRAESHGLAPLSTAVSPGDVTQISALSARQIYANLIQRKWEIRSKVMDRGKRLLCCLHFVDVMKEQRGVNRHKRLEPRSFSGSSVDKTITHPLPLFDIGQVGDSNGKIMSRSETFSSDFRTFALRSLEQLVILSENSNDMIALAELSANSTLTVLVSLLSNEAGYVQQLSCMTLANLFAIENLQIKQNGEIPGSGPFAYQIQRADGIKALYRMLTSPSATVNLVNGRSAAVQGMSNSEASRALVSLFAALPIRTYSRNRASFVATVSAATATATLMNANSNSNGMVNDTRKHDATQEYWDCDLSELRLFANHWPSRQIWAWTYYGKSGTVKSSHLCNMTIALNLMINGRGSDDNGPFEITGEATQGIEGKVWQIYKTYIAAHEIYATSDADSVEDWVMQNNVTQQQDLKQAMLRAHVQHTLYFASSNKEYSSLEEGEYNHGFQCGFYGVWEMSTSTGSGGHFELDITKGGVLRISPVF